jgi:hypothetical protein
MKAARSVFCALAFALVLAPAAASAQCANATIAQFNGTQMVCSSTLTAPNIVGGTATALTALSVDNTAAAFNLLLASNDATMAANRTLTFNTANGNRTLFLSGDLTNAGGQAITLTATGSTNVTLPTTGTLATLAGTEVFTNKTITGLLLTAGTTAVAPLTFASGSLLTTPAAGAQEYLTNVFYTTPNASNRGVSPSVHFLSLSANQTGADTASAQTWFPGGGATQITLPASTSYFFEGTLILDKAAGTTSHTIANLFGGTATITSIDYVSYTAFADTSNPVGNFGNLRLGHWNAATASTIVDLASTNADQVSFWHIRGIVRINGAGTFIPQFQYSAAPGGAPAILANSYFRMYPIGTNTVLNVGNWN